MNIDFIPSEMKHIDIRLLMNSTGQFVEVIP